MIRKIGLHFDKRVIEIETNVGLFLDSYLLSLYSHGAFLSSVGHLLSSFFCLIYIPASYTYADTNRLLWGSHPRVDPLWSTEALGFIHDGCEATRVEKAALIAKSDVALNSLRVCFVGHNLPYNCGRCEKCIRTMINLHCVDALDRCTTFENQLNTKHIEKMRLYNHGVRLLIEENLQALKNRPDDRDLYNVLHTIWKQSWWVKFQLTSPRLYRIRWIYRILRSLGRFSGKFLDG